MYKKTKKREPLKNLFKLLLLISSTLFAIENNPYIGGVAVVDIGEFDIKPKVYFKAKRVKVLEEDNHYRAIIGIGLNEKVGKKHIVAVGGGVKKHFYFQVQPKAYKKEYIKLKTNKRVNLSKPDLSRHYKEKAKSKALLNSFHTDLVSDLNFIIPLKGRLSSPFGKRRYFNNVPKAPHSGMDIAAKKGTPIKAAQSGIVSIREEFFFTGNTIYLDHGEGVVSIYAHMDRFNVELGDYVNKGDIIGFVGATGRATGAHLHFGVSLNGYSINPNIIMQ
jgi:murein DD-endopeptidase MepM/ murein hydrolase activator NlpD